MKLSEFCQRIDVQYRHARYVLEQGILPAGVADQPGRGEHRDLDSAQAFWLAIVLKLKASGVQAPVAGQVAEFAREGVQGIARHLSWDPGFHPFAGRMEAENRWYVDVGDLAYLRMVTDANPSGGGQLEEFPWVRLGTRREAKVEPVVVLRMNITRIAALLKG